MRLAYVNQDRGIAPGKKKGASTHVAALQDALRGEGCEVVAIEQKSDAGVREALRLAALEAPFDFVYERHALGACGAARYCCESSTPLLLEVNSPLLEEARDHRGFLVTEDDLAREQEVLNCATRLFPVSSIVADYLRRRGVRDERMRVTPNAVDTRVFRADAPRPTDLDLPEGAFTVGFHGRLRPWHNFALLGRALVRLLALGREVRVLAIGEGDFEGELGAFPASRVVRRGWMGPSELASHVACFDVEPLTYSADAVCYFSPLKLYEAMACAVTPVVPDLGDLPDAVEHGRCGVVYRAGDESALAAALDALAEAPQLRAKLGAAAAAKAATRSWSHVAREILSTVAEGRLA